MLFTFSLKNAVKCLRLSHDVRLLDILSYHLLEVADLGSAGKEILIFYADSSMESFKSIKSYIRFSY